MAHSLEESARYQAAHSPNSSSHWNNQYAHRLSTVRKPPPTGGKHPRTGLQTSQNLQSLEELVRWQAYQHPNLSTHWRNLPAQVPPNCPDSSSEWRNRDVYVSCGQCLDAKARRLESMAHTITIGRNTNPKQTPSAPDWVAVTNSASPAEPGPACATPRNTAITVVENVPESRWNRLNNALPSAFRPGRKHGHTARRRIGGTHRESRHGHETPQAEHERLRRHSVMTSSQPAWRLFARVSWSKSLPHAAGSERQKANKMGVPERYARREPRR